LVAAAEENPLLPTWLAEAVLLGMKVLVRKRSLELVVVIAESTNCKQKNC